MPPPHPLAAAVATLPALHSAFANGTTGIHGTAAGPSLVHGLGGVAPPVGGHTHPFGPYTAAAMPLYAGHGGTASGTGGNIGTDAGLLQASGHVGIATQAEPAAHRPALLPREGPRPIRPRNLLQVTNEGLLALYNSSTPPRHVAQLVYRDALRHAFDMTPTDFETDMRATRTVNESPPALPTARLQRIADTFGVHIYVTHTVYTSGVPAQHTSTFGSPADGPIALTWNYNGYTVIPVLTYRGTAGPAAPPAVPAAPASPPAASLPPIDPPVAGSTLAASPLASRGPPNPAPPSRAPADPQRTTTGPAPPAPQALRTPSDYARLIRRRSGLALRRDWLQLAQAVYHQQQPDQPRLIPAASPPPSLFAAVLHLLRGTSCTQDDLRRLVGAASATTPEATLQALANGLGICLTIHAPQHGSVTHPTVLRPRSADAAATDATRSLHLLRVPSSRDTERGYAELRFAPLQPETVGDDEPLADAALMARVASLRQPHSSTPRPHSPLAPYNEVVAAEHTAASTGNAPRAAGGPRVPRWDNPTPLSAATPAIAARFATALSAAAATDPSGQCAALRATLATAAAASSAIPDCIHPVPQHSGSCWIASTVQFLLSIPHTIRTAILSFHGNTDPRYDLLAGLAAVYHAPTAANINALNRIVHAHDPGSMGGSGSGTGDAESLLTSILSQLPHDSPALAATEFTRVNTYTCRDCGLAHEVRVPEYVLRIPPGGPIDIMMAMCAEHPDGPRGCDRCSRPNPSVRPNPDGSPARTHTTHRHVSHLENIPETLLVSYPRRDLGTEQVYRGPLNAPLELDLRPLLLSPGRRLADLRPVLADAIAWCAFSGSALQGHYTCCVQLPDGRRFHVDDGNATPRPGALPDRTSTVLLRYQRRRPASDDSCTSGTRSSTTVTTAANPTGNATGSSATGEQRPQQPQAAHARPVATGTCAANATAPAAPTAAATGGSAAAARSGTSASVGWHGRTGRDAATTAGGGGVAPPHTDTTATGTLASTGNTTGSAAAGAARPLLQQQPARGGATVQQSA